MNKYNDYKGFARLLSNVWVYRIRPYCHYPNGLGVFNTPLLILVALIIIISAPGIFAQETKSDAEIVDSLFMRASSGLTMFRDQVEPSKKALIEMGARAIPQMLTKLDTRSAGEMQTISAIFKGIGEIAVDSLTKRLSSSDDYVRHLAINCLADIKSPKTIPALAKLVDHSDFATRAGVMNAFGQIGDKTASGYVTQGLLDSNEVVATAAAVACGKIKIDIDPLTLIDAFDHPYYGVRYTAMQSLIQLGEISVAPLISYLQTHPFDISFGYAIEALGEIGSRDALPIFEQTINYNDWSVRAFTAEALGKLNQPKAKKIIQKAMTIETHPLVVVKLKASLAKYEKTS